MKLVAMADLHGTLPTVPPCDVLVIAGDLCPNFHYDPALDRAQQVEWLHSTYKTWEDNVPTEHILLTPGNHDWFPRLPGGWLPGGNRTRMGVDEEVTINGVRFWLTPWVEPVNRWNWMLRRGARIQRFAAIPFGIDVLVSHSPAHDVLDKNFSGEHIGCLALREAIYTKRPDVHVFGHCHEGRRHGTMQVLGHTQCYNVSLGLHGYEPVEIHIETEFA